MSYETLSELPIANEQTCLRALLRKDYDVVQGPNYGEGDIPGEKLVCRMSDECRLKRVNEFAFGRQIDFQLDRCVDQKGVTPRTHLSRRPEA